MKPIPIYNERALLLGEHLIIADLHLGLEQEFAQRGAIIPSQHEKMLKSIVRLLAATGAKNLVILGDLKHGIPHTTVQEYREIPELVNVISKRASVSIIKGNHDGDLEKLLPRTKILRSLGIGSVLLAHGHTALEEKEFAHDYIILGHNHPCIEFRDELGRSTKESAWLRAKLRRDFLEQLGLQKSPQIIVMPAFNELISGTPLNSSEELLGPLFRRKFIDVENARVYLLDGTLLGRVKKLRELR